MILYHVGDHNMPEDLLTFAYGYMQSIHVQLYCTHTHTHTHTPIAMISGQMKSYNNWKHIAFELIACTMTKLDKLRYG